MVSHRVDTPSKASVLLVELSAFVFEFSILASNLSSEEWLPIVRCGIKPQASEIY